MSSSEQCACIFPQPCSSEGAVGTIRRSLRTEFLNKEDGTTYSRLHMCGSNSNQWRELIEILRPSAVPPNKLLWVVRQRQEGNDPHWSLFCALDDNTDSPIGRVWQVNGDADVGMRYAHRGPNHAVPMFLAASFADKLLVSDQISEHWEAQVDQIANTIKPPAPDEALPRRCDYRRGTCKTWVWQVLDELVKEGIIPSEAAEKARHLPDLEPVD